MLVPIPIVLVLVEHLHYRGISQVRLNEVFCYRFTSTFFLKQSTSKIFFSLSQHGVSIQIVSLINIYMYLSNNRHLTRTK